MFYIGKLLLSIVRYAPCFFSLENYLEIVGSASCGLFCMDGCFGKDPNHRQSSEEKIDGFGLVLYV